MGGQTMGEVFIAGNSGSGVEDFDGVFGFSGVDARTSIGKQIL
jgi:hypothetical protein